MKNNRLAFFLSILLISGLTFCGSIAPSQAAGTVVAWGWNQNGQVNVPPGLTNVVKVAAGAYGSLALRTDGTVAAWGSNDYGQNDGALGLSGITDVAAGYMHRVVVRTNGTVVAWGVSAGAETMTNVPPDLTNVVAVAAGNYASMARRSDGSVVVWGSSYFFDLYGLANVPSALTNAIAISAGAFHCVALSASGRVFVWGANNYGQLNVPAAALSNVVAIASGSSHVLALKNDGTVLAWGWNGAPWNWMQATVPPGLSNVVQIAACSATSLALKSDNTLIGWGNNDYGARDNLLNLTTIESLAGGSYFTVAIITNAPPAPPPSLSITSSNQNVIVSWPLSAAGFVPDQTTSLNGTPISWTPVSPPYQTNGTDIRVSVPASTGNLFFRLHKPQ